MEMERCPGCMQIKQSGRICSHCGFDGAVQNAAHQLPIGTLLRNQYRIGRVLGQGGFGITYLGWDQYLDIPVAIKEYYPSGMVMREATISRNVVNCLGDDIKRFDANRDRFMREAKVLARFSEAPEIVQVKNFFMENNTAYIVMEYVQGITLKQYVKNMGGTISAKETLDILRPIMHGLSKVHEEGIVHRDISPDNIMLLPNGGVKLLDFGAVRDVGAPVVDRELTKSTEAILKQGYAPIEQYQKKGSLGPWTDVYALCATIYYCLTGCVPPDAPARMLDEEVMDFSKLTQLTPMQQNAIACGMEIKAVNRFRSVGALHMALLGTPIAPQEAENPAPPPAKEEITEKNPLAEDNNATQDHASAQEQKEKQSEEKRRGKGILFLVAGIVAVVVVAPRFLQPKEENPSIEFPEEPKVGQIQEQTLPPLEKLTIIDDGNPKDNVIREMLPGEAENIWEASAFGTEVRRKEVRSVTVLDTVDEVPENAVDISGSQEGDVFAWTVPNGELYDVFIAGEGGVLAPENGAYLFAGYENMETIQLGCLSTDNTRNFSAMFMGCSSLTELDLTGIRTGNAQDMSFMFQNCKKIQQLDISGFATENVTTMSGMFDGCVSLTGLDVTVLNTSKVANMSAMFKDCGSLTQLDIKGFDTSKATKMNSMFEGCSSIDKLELSSFSTVRVTNMSRMFYGCASLVQLDLSRFSTTNLSDMQGMFTNCTGLKKLDVSKFRTENITDMSFLFANCRSLTTLNISMFDTSSVTDMEGMFQNCESMTQLNLGSPNTSNVTNMASMFDGCSSLERLNIAVFKTGKVENMADMFSGCGKIKFLDISGLDTSSVTDMSGMFRNCALLSYLGVNEFDTKNVTDMGYMFYNCASLTFLKIENFNTSNVTDMQYMFHECRGLKELDLRHFDTSKVTNMEGMLYGCDSLNSLNIGAFDTSNVRNFINFMEDGKKIDGRTWGSLFSQ